MALRVAPVWWSMARVPTLPQKQPKPDSQRIRRGHLEPGVPSIIGTLRHSVSHVDRCLRHRRVSFDPFPLHGPFHLKASFFFSFLPKSINHCLYVVACRRHHREKYSRSWLPPCPPCSALSIPRTLRPREANLFSHLLKASAYWATTKTRAMDDEQRAATLAATTTTPAVKSDAISTDSDTVLTPDPEAPMSPNSFAADHTDHAILDTPILGATTPKSPRLSRNPSFSGSSSYHEDWDALPPLDRLTVLDLLDNFALPQQLEKLQKGISAQTDKVRRSRDVLKSKTQLARERMVEEWRRRVPSADEQLDRYRKQMRRRVDKLGKQWNNTKAISLREKISFICGVLNIFISGYLIGGHPEHFHLWYTAQLLYFMPIRYFTYHRRGYHYFLADLCYFVNFLLLLSIWVFPSSKRFFMAAYCLAYGNNAVAIIMWRNSLVFHSFDKVTSLFIHIMPCATLHCIVHLLPPETQKLRFPAIWTIMNSEPGSPTAYANVVSMLAWSTVPYIFWQLAYFFFISIRRKEKIAAGRPTSFTWLRKSYSKTWIGKMVLACPEGWQEAVYMLIQFAYAVLTMLPCPLWFLSRYASSAFLLIVFVWSIYNGATYYIDVFGNRFQKELEAMKAEVMKWQNSPETMPHSPSIMPRSDDAAGPEKTHRASLSTSQIVSTDEVERGRDMVGEIPLSKDDSDRNLGVDQIPLLDEPRGSHSTAVDGDYENVTRERKTSGVAS